MLDLAFRCEKRFGVRVQFQQVLDPELAGGAARGASTDELKALFTVQVITDFVRAAVQNGGRAPANSAPLVENREPA